MDECKLCILTSDCKLYVYRLGHNKITLIDSNCPIEIELNDRFSKILSSKYIVDESNTLYRVKIIYDGYIKVIPIDELENKCVLSIFNDMYINYYDENNNLIYALIKGRIGNNATFDPIKELDEQIIVAYTDNGYILTSNRTVYLLNYDNNSARVISFFTDNPISAYDKKSKIKSSRFRLD